MKKSVAFFVLAVLLCGLWGCASDQSVAGTEVLTPLPYSYSCVKCTQNLLADTSDDVTVIRSVAELEQYSEKSAAYFDFSKGVQGEESATLTQKLAVYNETFFETKTLIIVRRNFVTDNELVLLDGETDGAKNAVIHARFDKTGAYEKSVRFFLVQVKSEHFPKDMALSLDISEAESSTLLSDVAMLIAKGDANYKTVSDPSKIEAVKSVISSFSYTETENTFDDYTPGITDIAVSYQDYIAVFAEDFIYINGASYAPNASAKQRMVEVYNGLEEKAERVTEDPADTDASTE